MTNREFVKRLGLGATLVAVGCFIVFALLAVTTPKGEPLDNKAASTAGAAGGATPRPLECPRGDLVLTAESYISHAPNRSRRATPSEALSTSLSHVYPGLSVSVLQEEPRPGTAPGQDTGETTKVFTRSIHGKRRVIAEVVKVGDGWTLGRYEACNSTLKAARKGRQG